MKQKLQAFFFLTIGTLLVALGVHFFKFPNNFSLGGVTGLAIILSRAVPAPALSPGTYVMILNVLFLAVGFLVLNRGFGLRTVYCSLLFSGLCKVFEWIFPLSRPLTDQKLLELFFAVILPALGSAILFNLEASTGGTDIAAMILKKFSSLDIGKALLCSDIVIASSTFFLFDVETGLFSVLGLVLKSVLVDTVIESLNRHKFFLIITSNPEPVCGYIISSLHRDATFWSAQGAYTRQNHAVVLTVLSRGQAVILRRYLRVQDPNAFMLVANSSEIFGKGFLRA
ncbi:MAG: YitT family protein [Intestinimonas sp.]|nr:YitT family protein [Intestinimonas sp.]